jgi:hypothetical protein
MRLLAEKFNELRGLLKNGVGSIRPTGFDPVYYLLFPPQQIIEVKQRLPEWEAQLLVDGFRPHHLSMTQVINDYFRAHELRESLIDAARLQADDHAVINGSLIEHLKQDNVVGAAILSAIRAHQHDSTSVLFLTDLEALHPFLRIGAVEQQLVGSFAIPTVVLYPGTAGGAYSRRFLGVHREDGNYRSPHID